MSSKKLINYLLSALLIASGANAQSVNELFSQAEKKLAILESQIASMEQSGEDLDVLYGNPLPHKKTSLNERCNLILATCDELSRLISVSVEASDEQGMGNRVVRDAILEASAGQIPLRRARAHILLAATQEFRADRRPHLDQASEAIGTLRGTSVWLTYESRMLTALQELLDGRPERSIALFDSIRLDLTQADSHSVVSEYAPVVVFGLLCSTNDLHGWARARPAMRSLYEWVPFADLVRHDPALALVAADIRAEIECSRAQSMLNSEDREAILDEAFGGYELLAGVLTRSGIDEERAWETASREAAGALREWMPRLQLPTIALLGECFTNYSHPLKCDWCIDRMERAVLASTEKPVTLVRLAKTAHVRMLTSRETRDTLSRACVVANAYAKQDPEYGKANDQAILIATSILKEVHPETLYETAYRVLEEAYARGTGIRVPLAGLHLANGYARRGDELSVKRALELLAKHDSRKPTTSSSLFIPRIYLWLLNNDVSGRSAQGLLKWGECFSESTNEGLRAIGHSYKAIALLSLGRSQEAHAAARAAAEANLRGVNSRLSSLTVRALKDTSFATGDMDGVAMVLDGVRKGSLVDHQRAYVGVATGLVSRVRPQSELFLAGESQPLSQEAHLLTRVYKDRFVQSAVVDVEKSMYEALILGGDARAALEIVTDLLAKRADTSLRLRVRTEALIALESDEEAFRYLREITQMEGETSQLSWYAWARMLEILERQNANGARTETIRREITRLRASEGYATCAECAERIEAVASRIGMGPR